LASLVFASFATTKKDGRSRRYNVEAAKLGRRDRPAWFTEGFVPYARVSVFGVKSSTSGTEQHLIHRPTAFDPTVLH